ncbi:MAG: GNAT family N-acetyltransferase [Micromonosporaceae bacterium]
MEPVELSVDDLLIRPWRESDADAVYRACQDPMIHQWTTVPSPYLPEHAAEFTGTRSPAGWQDGSSANFGVFDAGTGELLGSNGVVTIDARTATGELGYWTAPWARGRDVTVRASRAVAGWAFGTLGLERLIWQAMIGNWASRLVGLRAGFRIEGRLRLVHPGQPGAVEGWVGSMLPSDLTDELPAGFGPDSLVARRAKVFGQPQPVLRAEAPSGPITLRRPTERDLDAMVASCRDPESVRWTTVPDPYHRSDAEWYLRHIADQWADGAGLLCGLYDDADNYCGSFGLRLMADPQIGDVGFLVSPWARGKGYASAAVRALCKWGFDQLDLSRIEWRAHVGNHASKRVAEKAGFVLEGTERAGCPQRGERRDSWVAALLPGDVAGQAARRITP